MKAFYSINEVATMTGLSTKTIRNYIASGLLTGEKYEGKWVFSLNAIENMIKEPFVDASIQIKNGNVVKDFLIADKKKDDSICIILDQNLSQEQAVLLSEFLCEEINKNDNQIIMNFSQKEGHVRVILTGPLKQVMAILMLYHEKFQ